MGAHCVVDEYVGYGDEGGRSYYEYKHQGGDVAVHLVDHLGVDVDLMDHRMLLQRQDYGVETVGACVVCLQVDFKFGEKRVYFKQLDEVFAHVSLPCGHGFLRRVVAE